MSSSIVTNPVPDPLPLVESDPGGRTQRQLLWSRIRADRRATISLTVVAVLLLVAITAPLLVSLLGLPDPGLQDSGATDEFGQATGPSSAHVLGVDQLGRDIASRTISGTRVSLAVALISTALSVVGGTIAGVLAGYYRGWVDTAVSRSLDVMLAFPILMLGIGLASACSIGEGCLVVGGKALISPGAPVVVVIIAIAGFPFIARIVRGQVLSLREKEYVSAARAVGASHRRVMVRHLLPNLAAPILVYATVLVPQNILFEAGLSFLGIGVQDPTPSWGQMLGDASRNPELWWFMLFPGLALVTTVLAFNLLGDGLQDALDPDRRR